MKAISRLLLACAAVTLAASQAAAGEFVVTGAGGYRYRNAPPPAYAHGPWRYRRDWAPRYYAPPQYHNDLGAAIAGALAGAALQLIPRATEALAARLPPPPGAPPRPAGCGSAAGAKRGSAAGTGYGSAAGGGRTAAGCATGRAAAGRAIARRRPARCHSG